MAVRMQVHDFAKEEDLIFGPYARIDILEKSVWAHDISGRKFRIADKDSLGFWIINDIGGHFLVRVRELWVSSMLDLDEEVPTPAVSSQ